MTGAPSRYELRFQSLFHSGRGFSFPCDARGEVQLDALSERTRNNYLYARAMVGRELAPPSVERRAWAHALLCGTPVSMPPLEIAN